MKARSRTNKAAIIAVDENKYFMALMGK